MEIENLREIYMEIAQQTDFKTAVEIHKLFGGQQINFPKKLYNTEYINSCIKKEYNGRNVRELALKFGMSERRIRQIIHKPQ